MLKLMPSESCADLHEDFQDYFPGMVTPLVYSFIPSELIIESK